MPYVDLTQHKPKFERPELLQHGQIPKPMHGTAPRQFMGKEVWDEMRKTAYGGNNYFCWACQGEGPLNAHECYDIDYEKGRLIFKEVVALCDLCHNFIHIGRMSILLMQGEITEKEFIQTVRHGRDVLSKAGLKANWGLRIIVKAIQPHVKADAFWMLDIPVLETPKGDIAPWDEWRLVYNGKEYKPRFKSPVAYLLDEES